MVINEENVGEFLKTIPRFPVNKKRHKKVEIPNKFASVFEQEQWEMEEIRRCKHGHNGMCGKMYFWFNYCKIKDVERGRISPDFRVCDAEWFKLIESCRPGGDNQGKGVVCVKRRRAGFSWKEACDAIQDAVFYPFSNIGMDSKTEKDSFDLFKKCQFIYDNLPPFLRASVSAGKSKDSMLFAIKIKDEKGNPIIVGTQSELFCVAPTDTAYEGRMLTKWVSDEAGKKKNLLTTYSMTEPCLSDGGIRRIGIPIIFGTAGDVDEGSAGLKELWYKAAEYDLIPFFFGGWMGQPQFMDEYGNDNPEKYIYWNIATRKAKARISKKALNDFIQQNPLSPEEALLNFGEGAGWGDPEIIRDCITEHYRNPFKSKPGKFRWGKENEPDVVFEPDPNGKALIFEEPIKDLMNGYSAGTDPIDTGLEDVVSKSRDLSDLCMYIGKKRLGADPKRPVFVYFGRSKKVNYDYEQCLMAQIYYNNCKNMIENNRNGMIKFYEYAGYKHLLQNEPVPKNRLLTNYIPRIGFKMTEEVKTVEFPRLVGDYIDDYCRYIPDVKLLEEFLLVGLQNTDRAMAFAAWLLNEDNDKSRVRDGQQGEVKELFKKKLKRVNGKITWVSH
jgi:hypothetical protein